MNLVILLCLCSFVVILAQESKTLRGKKSGYEYSQSIIDEAKVKRLEDFLFPNRTATISPMTDMRRLAISKPPVPTDTTTIKCSFCSKATMPNCWILNGLMVEETYLPLDTSRKETCAVIESLAERLQKEVFGNGRAFRDTPDCRKMVMQYMCLYYGSNNPQYRNYCDYSEVVNNEGQSGAQLTAKPPCRSFCVQVASTCANDPTFIQTCKRIQCPMSDASKCIPDPQMGPENIPLAANLGCDVPYYRTPYNAATPGFVFESAALSALVVFVALWMY